MAKAKYFWRIIITEDDVEVQSGQGTEDCAQEAARILALWLHEFSLHKFPKENGHTIQIKTIFEKVATMDDVEAGHRQPRRRKSGEESEGH